MGNSCQSPEKQRKVKISGPALMVLGFIGDIGSVGNGVQFYSFTDKKWLQPQNIPRISYSLNHESLIFNGELYYTTWGEHSGRYNLQMFDPATRQIVKLRYPFIVMQYVAMCACSRYIYFCGGSLPSIDQALRYDPRMNSVETLPPMSTPRANAAAIFYQGYLHVLGGHTNDMLNSVEIYDPVSRQWMNFPAMCETRAAHAVAILDDKLYVCGGTNRTSVEVYDPRINRWQLVASMNQVRSQFCVFAHEGQLYAVGGDDSWTIEVYNPHTNQWRIDNEMSAGVQIRTKNTSTSCFVKAVEFL